MKRLIRLAVVLVGLLKGDPSPAQNLGGVTGGSGGTGTTTTGGGTSNSGSGLGSLGNPDLSDTPVISALSTTSAANSTVLNSSNIFAAYYANPYFQGRAGATSGTAPGGFGQPLYGTGLTAGATGGRGGFASTTGIGTGTASRTTGALGGTTGAFGTTGGFGTTGAFGTTGRGGQLGGLGGLGGQLGGLGGLGGQLGGLNSASAAQVLPLPRQIAYTATFRFNVAPVTMPQLVSDARAVLARSSMLANARNIDLTAEGTVLVLRGTVASEDDARLAENMLRLTPGVREIRNELRYPGSSPQP